MIHAYVQGNYVKLDNKNAGVRGESNVTALALHFSPEWSDFSKRLLWKDSRGQKVVSVVLTPVINKDTAAGYPMEYHTEIPYEALAYMGWCSFIVEGFLPNDTAKVAKSVTARMYVQENEAEGDTPENTPAPTPSEIQQLQAAVDNAIGAAAADKAAAEQAAESAQLSASAASVNAKVAEDAAENASASANSASNFKSVAEQASARAMEAFTGAANAKVAAETAKAAAEKAKTGAETAKSLAESAKSQANASAQNASASAKVAAASATTAENAARAAQSVANNVGQAVQSASGSASSAAAHAEAAAGFASTAKAQASAASGHSNSAQLAQSAAEKAASEAAKAAEDAANAVSNQLSGYVKDAQTAAGNAASSATNAETMKNAAADNAAAAQSAVSAATAAQKAAEEARDDAIRQVQSDWDENDPSKASHTLHRTHWKEVIGENAEIVPLKSVTISALGWATAEGVFDGMKEGVWYTGTIGGMEFEGRCKKWVTELYIGNGHMLDSSLEDTGEFFCVNALGGFYYQFTITRPNIGASLKFELHSVQETVWHKLDPNFVDFVLEAPGGKKFRITVSDSGALSAVEVTE